MLFLQSLYVPVLIQRIFHSLVYVTVHRQDSIVPEYSDMGGGGGGGGARGGNPRVSRLHCACALQAHAKPAHCKFKGQHFFHHTCCCFYAQLSEGYVTWFVSVSVRPSICLLPSFLPPRATRQQHSATNRFIATLA